MTTPPTTNSAGGETHQEILTKAIKDAVAGGWEPVEGIAVKLLDFDFSENTNRVYLRYKRVTPIEEWSVYGLIFNHQFAQALWGYKLKKVEQVLTQEAGQKLWINLDGWQYHLQQMVIADDPIKYLGENI